MYSLEESIKDGWTKIKNDFVEFVFIHFQKYIMKIADEKVNEYIRNAQLKIEKCNIPIIRYGLNYCDKKLDICELAHILEFKINNMIWGTSFNDELQFAIEMVKSKFMEDLTNYIIMDKSEIFDKHIIEFRLFVCKEK
jgi:hypothetical protein